MYARQLVVFGRLEEAIEQVETAHRLSPFEKSASHELGVWYHWAGDDDRAIAHFEEMLELFPSFPGPYQTLGMIHCEHGRFDEGISLLEKARALSGNNPSQLAALGYGHALAGRPEEARKLLRELEERSKTEFVSPLDFALIHIALGENAEALTWMERAYDFRWVMLPFAAASPPFAPLRSEPRFQDLLRKMGLPQAKEATAI
jgi:Flp pilus assembly protein TadD